MKWIINNIPVLIIAISSLISVFSGVNQIWGFFNKINIASVVISVIVAIALFFYIPYLVGNNPLKNVIEENLKISVKTFSIIVALFVLFSGSIPYFIQFGRAYYFAKKGDKAIISGASAEAQYYWTKASYLDTQLGLKEKAIHASLCLAEAYYQMGKTKEANEILSTYEKSTDLSLNDQAKLYTVIGNMNEALGNYTLAEKNYQQAMQTAKKNSGTQATLMMNKAVILKQKGPNYQNEAIDLLNKSKTIFSHEKDYHALAQVFINQAAIFEFQPKESLAYLDSAENYAKKVKSDKTEGIILANKGLLYRKEGLLDKAEQNYKLAQQKFETIGDVLGQADMLISLANLDIVQSNFASALQKIKESMAWVNQISSDENKINYIYMAKLYSTQADLLESCGNMPDADKQHKLAIEILDKHRSYITEIDAKINYAGFLQRQNRNEDAYILLEELYNLITTDYSNKTNQAVLVATNNLGKRFQDAGNLDKAEQLYKVAIDMSVNMKDKFLEAQAKENLGIIYRWQLKENWNACFNDALAIYRQLENKSAELNCLFNIYSSGNGASSIPEILDQLNNSSIDDYTRTIITLGILIIDIPNNELLLIHKNNLESLLKRLEKNNNIMLIGKCHLRLAQIEQRLGNSQNIENHLDPIEKSISLFPFPQNISVSTDLAFLKLNIGKTREGIDDLFCAFDLAEFEINQQMMLLHVIGAYWPFLESIDKKRYVDKLRGLMNNSENPIYIDMIRNFMANNSN